MNFRQISHFGADLSSLLLTAYATWRIGPTQQEMRSYNTTEKVLLTFDDYAEEQRIRDILHILKTEKIKAIFFLVGSWAKKNPTLVTDIKRSGHWVGNHTKTHANLLKLTDKKVRNEIIGGPSSTLLRPPYGRYDKRVRRIAKELGYKICYWTVDSDDWKGLSTQQISDRVLQQIRPGACILLHLNGRHTLEALPYLIKQIREKGLVFCSEGKEVTI